jgi:hypothetical protein
LLVVAAAWCGLGPALPSRAGERLECTPDAPTTIAAARSGRWFIAASPSFQVCSLASAAEAERVARHCEQVRTALIEAWNGAAAAWSPRCQVVLYDSRDHYLRNVGAGAADTLGSSLVQPSVGPVARRRIDLRADVDNVLAAALPHELCHVVLADRFRAGPPPLWFDEGVALLYDPPEKRALHDRDWRRAVERGGAVPWTEFLAAAAYPQPREWPAFYGQSAALVRALLDLGTPGQLASFAEHIGERGPHDALRDAYALDAPAKLDTLVRASPTPLRAAAFRVGAADEGRLAAEVHLTADLAPGPALPPVNARGAAD